MPTLYETMDDESELPPHVTSSRAEGTSRRYLLIALTLCLAIYLFPFFALHSGIKPAWWISYWSAVIDTDYQNQHQDADVVIFGDSAAVTNIDPMRMTHDLGYKVIVLPNVATSLPVTGYDPLEQYLRTNKQPRLIVFYFSAWDLDFMHTHFTPIVEEGLEMILLHGSWAQFGHYAIRHPGKIALFPFHFLASDNGIGDFLYFRRHEVPRMEQGHLLYLSHPTPMKSDCEFEPWLLKTGFKDASAREAVTRFTRPGTQTLVFLSPLPNCKSIDVIKNAPHPGLAIPPIQTLPPGNFREDTWQVHMLTGRIGPSTDYLEEVLRQKLQPLASEARRQ